jgi:hypothetical protein
MRLFTARGEEGCGGGLAVMPRPYRPTLSLALVFDNTDCARRLRAGGGDSRGEEGVPKSGLVKVTPGELGERDPSLLLIPPLPLLDGVVVVEELSERNCSWLVARTSWTLAAQSSRSYNLCNNSLNVNG